MPLSLLLNKFREMIGAEESYAEELEKEAGRLRHPVLQALLEAIALDSRNHSIFYKVLVEVLETKQPMISEEGFEELTRIIDKHIEAERVMIELTRKLAEEASDPKIKMILEAIHEDEVKHHKLLVDLKEKIARAETLTEEDFWYAVWKDSPWHGAPGG